MLIPFLKQNIRLDYTANPLFTMIINQLFLNILTENLVRMLIVKYFYFIFNIIAALSSAIRIETKNPTRRNTLL